MLSFAVSAALAATLMANKVSAGALTVSEAPVPSMVTSTVYATSALTVTTCGDAARCPTPSTTVITITTAVSTTICPAESVQTSVLSIASSNSNETPASPSTAIVSSATAEAASSSPAPSSDVGTSVLQVSSMAPLSPSGGLSFYIVPSNVVGSSLVAVSSMPTGITADTVPSSSAIIILSSSAEVAMPSSAGVPPVYSVPVPIGSVVASSAVTQVNVPSSSVVSIVSSAITQDNVFSSGGLVNPPPMSYPIIPMASSKTEITANPSATSPAIQISSTAPIEEDSTVVETVSLDRTMTATVIPVASSNATTLSSTPMPYGLASITPGVTANPNAVFNGTASGPMATPSVFTGSANSVRFAATSILVIVAIAAML